MPTAVVRRRDDAPVRHRRRRASGRGAPVRRRGCCACRDAGQTASRCTGAAGPACGGGCRRSHPEADGNAAKGVSITLPADAAAGVSQPETMSVAQQADGREAEVLKELRDGPPGRAQEDAAVAPALNVAPAATACDGAPRADDNQIQADDLAARPQNAPHAPRMADASLPEERHQPYAASHEEAGEAGSSILAAASAEGGPSLARAEPERTASAAEAAALWPPPPMGEQPDLLAPFPVGDPVQGTDPDAGEAPMDRVQRTQPGSGQHLAAPVHRDVQAATAAAGQLPSGGPPAAGAAAATAGVPISGSRPAQDGSEEAVHLTPTVPEFLSGSAAVARQEVQQGGPADATGPARDGASHLPEPRHPCACM